MFELMKHLWREAGSGRYWHAHARWLAWDKGDGGCSVCRRMRVILDTHPKII